MAIEARRCDTESIVLRGGVIAITSETKQEAIVDRSARLIASQPYYLAFSNDIIGIADKVLLRNYKFRRAGIYK